MTDQHNDNTADLKRPWQTRDRTDRQVTGTIELAYLRGYQAGYEDRAREQSASGAEHGKGVK